MPFLHFDVFTRRELLLIISTYKAYHNISFYHKMSKGNLIKELDNRFVYEDGNLYLKLNLEHKR